MRFSHHTKIYLETALLKMAQYSSTADRHQGDWSSIDPAIDGKVATLERLVRQLTQQIQSGVPIAVPQAKRSTTTKSKITKWLSRTG